MRIQVNHLLMSRLLVRSHTILLWHLVLQYANTKEKSFGSRSLSCGPLLIGLRSSWRGSMSLTWISQLDTPAQRSSETTDDRAGAIQSLARFVFNGGRRRSSGTTVSEPPETLGKAGLRRERLDTASACRTQANRHNSWRIPAGCNSAAGWGGGGSQSCQEIGFGASADFHVEAPASTKATSKTQ